MGKNSKVQAANRVTVILMTTGETYLLHQKEGTLLKSWPTQFCIIAFHMLCFGVVLFLNHHVRILLCVGNKDLLS